MTDQHKYIGTVIAGAVGLAFLIAFLLPPIVKLKDWALVAVALIGIGMAAYEFWENVRSRED